MSRGNTILLVEDNPDDLELTLRAFRKSSVPSDIVVARDGVEALDYLFFTGAHAGQDARAMPDVILLDLKLPKVDGVEVLRRMRGQARTRRIPVVILTTSREDRDIQSCYDLGANSFIRKPVDFAQFLDMAQQLGLYWLGLNEAAPSAYPAAPTKI